MLECFSQVERGIDFGPCDASSELGLPFEVMCNASNFVLGLF